MLPFFALAQYFDWAYDEATLTIRGLRLFLLLGGSGVSYLLFAKLLKVSEIAGLRGFATSVLQRRRKK
jgi:putative peptidoglycan lipid II flippase